MEFLIGFGVSFITAYLVVRIVAPPKQRRPETRSAGWQDFDRRVDAVTSEVKDGAQGCVTLLAYGAIFLGVCGLGIMVWALITLT